MSVTYADFLASSCHEVIILRDIGHDEQGDMLFLLRGGDKCLRNDLFLTIVSRLLENFTSSALLERLVLVDLSAGESPRGIRFPSFNEDALMTKNLGAKILIIDLPNTHLIPSAV